MIESIDVKVRSEDRDRFKQEIARQREKRNRISSLTIAVILISLSIGVHSSCTHSENSIIFPNCFCTKIDLSNGVVVTDSLLHYRFIVPDSSWKPMRTLTNLENGLTVGDTTGGVLRLLNVTESSYLGEWDWESEQESVEHDFNVIESGDFQYMDQTCRWNLVKFNDDSLLYYTLHVTVVDSFQQRFYTIALSTNATTDFKQRLCEMESFLEYFKIVSYQNKPAVVDDFSVVPKQRKKTIDIDSLRNPNHNAYLTDISFKEIGRLILADSVKPIDNNFTFTLLDTISSCQPEELNFFLSVFDNIKSKSDGALAEVVGLYSWNFIKKRPEAFISHIATIDQENIDDWAQYLVYEMYFAYPADSLEFQCQVLINELKGRSENSGLLRFEETLLEEAKSIIEN